ncbi:MAG: fasciclin domain-containing protein [Prevotella sp.]|nr:fasciclin domain-containing protein [Prevotella sp.]
MKIMKLKNKIFALIAMTAMAMPVLTSCSDEPDDEYYYSFTGEMMSDYLKNRSQYTQFTAIVQKAGMMDLLSSYGHYTCFAPSNDAVNRYLAEKGRSSVDELSVSECDTIARTHLVSTKVYSTYDLSSVSGGVMNMRGRLIDAKDTVDANGNAVVMLNKSAIIEFVTQNDSVENGIVQPINGVLENSMKTVADLIKQNPKLSLYYLALERTGLAEKMMAYEDKNYVQPEPKQWKYTSGGEPDEIALSPEHKYYGFTAFMVPDSILLQKGYITTDPSTDAGRETALKELFNTAKNIYDTTFPQDAASFTSYDPATLKNEKNPLYRFMAYHILPRKMDMPAYLTVRDDLGIFTKYMNPTEWYETMLPYTMLKVEKYTVDKSGVGSTAVLKQHYLNRRFDFDATKGVGEKIEGVRVHHDVESNLVNDGLNGFYFYIDDIVKFDAQTRDVVDNARMRVDMSALFPEMMTNGHRMNGDYQIHKKDAILDKMPEVGYNYWYPDGYLTGVTCSGGYFIYRHPRSSYWSYSGDEMIVQGNFDVSFRLPPVPTAGTYQVRLGYAAMNERTIAQFYFGDTPKPTNPQGTPVDMFVMMDNARMLGTNFQLKYEYTAEDHTTKTATGYTAVRELAYPSEEGKEPNQECQDLLSNDQKVLKNMGYYRGSWGCGCGTGSQDSKTHFADINTTFRIVLCTVDMEPGKYYYVRIRKATNILRGKNECMLDYIEVVPKSVYGVTDGAMREDDL